MIVWLLPPPLLFLPFLRLSSPHAEGVHRKLETCRHVRCGSTDRWGGGKSSPTYLLLHGELHVMPSTTHPNGTRE
jgi:hypothetical protein